jgi:hypothetical protein
MSAAPASGAAPQTTKATTTDKSAETKDTKPAAALEEDDEFEDFPVESTFPPAITIKPLDLRKDEIDSKQN